MKRANGMRRIVRGTIYAFGAVVLGLAFAAPAHAAPPLEVTKTVTHVNDAAPPAGDVVEVAAGDSIGYAINVSGNPSFGGTDVTITDAFNASVLVFETASVGGCVAQAGLVSCTVRLADSGDAEVVLTFRVLDVGDCDRLVNRVEVTGERESSGSAEAEIEACPAPGGVLAGTPAPDTAMYAPSTSMSWAGVAIGVIAVLTALIRATRSTIDEASPSSWSATPPRRNRTASHLPRWPHA
jgi:hypothetical protein